MSKRRPRREDRRRLCASASIDQRRVQHVTGSKAALRQAYPATSRCAAIDGNSSTSETGDGRPCQSISRPRSAGSSIGSNCCSSKSRRWRLSGRVACRAKSRAARAGGHVTGFQWHRPNSPRFSGRRTVPALRQSAPSCFLCRLAPTPWQSGSVDHEQEFRSRQSSIATHSFNSPGYGCAISRNPRWLCGLRTGCAQRRPS